MAAAAGAGAAATPAPVKPGTSKQVAQLVAAAQSIKKLPSVLTPSLADAPKDQPETYFPSLTDCVTNNVTAPSCVFGDVNGTKTMVLFGDSHAYMWFSALDEIAIAAKWKLVALLDYGCPVADVTVWNSVTKAPDTGCPPHRKAMIERIDKLNPNLVIMAEKFVPLDAKRQAISDTKWEAALEKSLAALHSPSMKKVLIGNTMQIENMFTCLAANPSNIQRCSVPEDNASTIGQRAAEVTAATAEKVHYINEIPWLCSTTCTVVIGHFIAYDSPGHLSNTYALYLEGVLKQALRPYM
jgi:SGNH domain (fused to AT3 domains)